MVIVIDAINIRGGGGVTHLVELLKATDPSLVGVKKIYVCATKGTINKIEDRPWLVKYNNESFEKSTLSRFLWQILHLSNFLKECNCDILFVPGGTYFGSWKPFVTMSQNLLPFEWKEIRRYGFSKMLIKMLLLRITQRNTFKKSNGVIFLTKFSEEVVLKTINKKIRSCVIPHGINKRFESSPKHQHPITCYSTRNPYRILYVSSIDVYKHQNHVIKAISILREDGFPVVLDLVGPAHPVPFKRMQTVIKQLDPFNKFIIYHGALPYSELHEKYINANLGLFASSCETFGQIVTEAMSAGLPIACSKLSAMPDVLGDAGVYFNPEDPIDIASALKQLILNPNLRTEKALKGYNRSKEYSWSRCARETFLYITNIAKLG